MLNGGGSHLKWFPRSKQSPHSIPILEEYEHDATILQVDIKDLLKFDKNSITSVSICDAIINASLRF